MRVFNDNGVVLNVEDNCNSIDRLINNGAEEIPIEIFGDYPNFANSENTTFVNGEWVFVFDVDAQKVKELEQDSTDVKRKIDAIIQAEINKCNESTSWSFDNADSFAKYAINDNSDKQSVSLVFIDWIDSVWTACRECEKLIEIGDYDYPDTVADFITLANLPEIGEY